MFGPSVASGLLKPADLPGYRNHQVYIGGSLHTPLNKKALRDAMLVLLEFFDRRNRGINPRHVGTFHLCIYTSPYGWQWPDGSFFNECDAASGSYPWTVIPVERKEAYINSLEQASVYQNIEPFAAFLALLVKKAMEGKPVATI